MSDRLIIGGQPRYPHPEPDCTFLGKMQAYDLYHQSPCGKRTTHHLMARYGEELDAVVEGISYSYGQVKVLTAARRIAEYKGLLPVDPIRAMFLVVEPEDVQLLRRQLRNTEEYAVLKAYAEGKRKDVKERLTTLMNRAELKRIFPSNPAARLLEVDVILFTMGRFVADDFEPSTFFNVTSEKFEELGGDPRRKDGA